MPPTMMTRSASWPATASRGRGTGGRAGRGGGRIRVRSGDQGNGRNDGQGGQVGGQGSELNDGVNGVSDFSTIIAQQLQNLLPTIIAQGDVSRGCTYKEFLAYNPKEYDGKGSTIVYTRWIEKIELVQDMSGYGDNQKVKYTDGSFLGKALTWWNSQIRTLGQEVAVVMLSDPYSAVTHFGGVTDSIDFRLDSAVYLYVRPLFSTIFLENLSEYPTMKVARQLLEQVPQPSRTPPLLPIPLPAPSTSRRADIPEADTSPRKRLLLTAPIPTVEVGESSAATAGRQPRSTMARRVDHSFVDTVDTRVRDTERRTMAAVEAQEDQDAVRAEIEILRRERFAYEQESIETRQALARSEDYSRALEARIRVLETQAYHHDLLSITGNSRLIVAQFASANAIEAIAIYESINQTKQQENKVAGNASNKRKWEGLCAEKVVAIASGGATKQDIVDLRPEGKTKALNGKTES
ncbi:hypothetical protein Tco_0232588 [Tanacetum coccineum]